MCGTWHILKQVEWYKKLKDLYGCSKIEMEYILSIPQTSVVKHHYRIDVYGENKNNKFIIEIGNIGIEKMRYLKHLKNRYPEIKFIHVISVKF